MSNNMYWITTLIFAIVLLITWIDEKSGMDKKTKGDRAFKRMLAYGIFFCFQDTLWGLCYSGIIRGDIPLFVVSSSFHLTIVLTSFHCMVFFLSYLEDHIRRKNVCISICLVVVAVQLIFVVSNFFTPVLFRIENGQYITKSLRPLSFINQYIVYFVSGIITFLCIKRADRKHRDKYKAVFLVAVIPLITGIFQLYYPETPLYSLGYFLECMIVHMFIITKDKNELSQMRILDSISSTYYSLHLFDLTNNSVEEYIESTILKNLAVDRNDAKNSILQVMTATVTEEYLEAVADFVNLDTLPERMKGYNSITMDFVGRFHGWTRATFISIEKDEEGILKKVMFATQIIDEQKKREQEMFARSRTDQLTKLLNRRAYESDINEIGKDCANMVYVSVDVNELKVVNDSLGHEAGDELLIGAARCMKQCFGPYGKIYRTGGDEFVVVIFATEEELARIKADIAETVNAWKGSLVESLSISCGYVAVKEVQDLSIQEISQLADKRMYQEKAKYYRAKGIDRRGQAAAHTVLCNLYTKILKINMTTDSYSIVNMDLSEQTKEKGFAPTISGWLHSFGKSGQVHEDDLGEYLEKTDMSYLKEYFSLGKRSISIHYRRRFPDGFKHAAMEMIPADDYSAENQTLFLYVKNIDG